MITFDKIVKKLLKSNSDILSIYDIWKIIDPDFSFINNSNIKKIYKVIYRLKSSWIISSLKNWLYIIWRWEDFNESIIIEKHYWKILHKTKHESNNDPIWSYSHGSKIVSLASL